MSNFISVLQHVWSTDLGPIIETECRDGNHYKL